MRNQDDGIGSRVLMSVHAPAQITPEERECDWPAVIAALVNGDRWLNADGCAMYLGMVTPMGRINRRGFLERIACLPNFPAPVPQTRAWKKSEVERWADAQVRTSRRR